MEGSPKGQEFQHHAAAGCGHPTGTHGVMAGHYSGHHGRFYLRPLQAFIRPFLHLIERKSSESSADTNHPGQSGLVARVGQVDTRHKHGVPHHRVIITDAPLLGWEAHLDGKLIQGSWSTQKAQHSISWLELKVIRLTLRHFQTRLSGTHVLVRTEHNRKSLRKQMGVTHSKVWQRRPPSCSYGWKLTLCH